MFVAAHFTLTYLLSAFITDFSSFILMEMTPARTSQMSPRVVLFEKNSNNQFTSRHASDINVKPSLLRNPDRHPIFHSIKRKNK